MIRCYTVLHAIISTAVQVIYGFQCENFWVVRLWTLFYACLGFAIYLCMLIESVLVRDHIIRVAVGLIPFFDRLWDVC